MWICLKKFLTAFRTFLYLSRRRTRQHDRGVDTSNANLHCVRDNLDYQKKTSRAPCASKGDRDFFLTD